WIANDEVNNVRRLLGPQLSGREVSRRFAVFLVHVKRQTPSLPEMFNIPRTGKLNDAASAFALSKAVRRVVQQKRFVRSEHERGWRNGRLNLSRVPGLRFGIEAILADEICGVRRDARVFVAERIELTCSCEKEGERESAVNDGLRLELSGFGPLDAGAS